MKKVLAALLVLAVVAPAMAVTITGSDLGDGKLRLTYDVPTGEVLRGVALKLSNTDGAAIAGTSAVTAIDSFFDVFIDYAFDNSEGFTVTPRVGHPLADPAAAGVLDAFPASTFSLSMGVLDETGNQGGVEGSGVLCEIQFALDGADATIVIEADTLRGGAVVGDAVTQPTIAPVLLDFADVCVVTVNSLTKTTAAPAIATRVNAGRTETFVASATSSLGHALEYQFTWGDGVVGPWGAATQTHVYTYTASTSYNVSVTARCTIDGATDAIDAPLVCTSEAVKSTATFYTTWGNWNRPGCWAYQRNCRGDTNSLATGLGTNRQWVNSADLTLLAAGFNKTEPNLALVANGICADFNRLATGLGTNRQWVNSADLTILASYFNKTEASVPLCDQANYHYWTTNLIPN